MTLDLSLSLYEHCRLQGEHLNKQVFCADQLNRILDLAQLFSSLPISSFVFEYNLNENNKFLDFSFYLNLSKYSERDYRNFATLP